VESPKIRMTFSWGVFPLEETQSLTTQVHWFQWKVGKQSQSSRTSETCYENTIAGKTAHNTSRSWSGVLILTELGKKRNEEVRLTGKQNQKGSWVRFISQFIWMELTPRKCCFLENIPKGKRTLQ
jgi:hypothetical protein